MDHGAGLAHTSTNAGHWLQVKLTEPAPNVDGVGSWIEVERGDAVTRREITVGGGHVSGEAGWWHFGLGDAAKADVRVVWPDGTAGDWSTVDADQFYTLERGKAAVVWTK